MPHHARLKATTIRFDPIAHELLTIAAAKAGIPMAQFVREAALMRAIMRELGAGTKPPLPADVTLRLMHHCSERVIELSGVQPPAVLRGGDGDGAVVEG